MINILKVFLPNRAVYPIFVAPLTSPEVSLINQLKAGKINLNDRGDSMECISLAQGEMTNKKGIKINVEKEGRYLSYNDMYILDNSDLTIIPGLHFVSEPCNICEIGEYLDPNNKCRFTISTPEALSIYFGNNSLLNSQDSSNISSLLGTSDSTNKDEKNSLFSSFM